MKAIFVNGSPRKEWNTSQLLQAAMKGAADKGAETELVHLSDYNVKGCQSCFACKVKGNTTNGICALQDDLRPLLERIMDADILVIGSPVYFGNLTSETLGLMERINFPVLNYKPPMDGKRQRTLPKAKKLGLIVDMGVQEANLESTGYKARFDGIGRTLSGLLSDEPCRMLYSCDAWQFTDYSRYDVTMFDVEGKKRHKEEQFPLDLEKAYALGAELAER